MVLEVVRVLEGVGAGVVLEVVLVLDGVEVLLVLGLDGVELVLVLLLLVPRTVSRRYTLLMTGSGWRNKTRTSST